MSPNESKAKILVVDDEPLIVLVLTSVLSLEGHEVVSAGNLEDARKEFDRCAFPVVITDLRLSDSESMEGLELIRHVKASSPKTGVIVMSASASEDTRNEAHVLGASRYHSKPFDIDEMLGSVRDMAHAYIQ
jgi:DNA-binding NtrC family response regulator